MTSAQSALPAFYILVTVFCGPPILGLLACLRRLHYTRQRGRNGNWYLAGVVASGAALLFNVGVCIATARGITTGGAEFGPPHAMALALSWFSFWLWITVLVIRYRRPRRPRRRIS